MLIRNNHQEGTLHIVAIGQQSRNLLVGASVPQGSVPGPGLWILLIDDLLSLPTVSTYGDNCMLFHSYCRQDNQRVNYQLRLIEEWEAHWQVNFAHEKTQTMVFPWFPAVSQTIEEWVMFDNQPSTPGLPYNL